MRAFADDLRRGAQDERGLFVGELLDVPEHVAGAIHRVQATEHLPNPVRQEGGCCRCRLLRRRAQPGQGDSDSSAIEQDPEGHTIRKCLSGAEGRPKCRFRCFGRIGHQHVPYHAIDAVPVAERELDEGSSLAGARALRKDFVGTLAEHRGPQRRGISQCPDLPARFAHALHLASLSRSGRPCTWRANLMARGKAPSLLDGEPDKLSSDPAVQTADAGSANCRRCRRSGSWRSPDQMAGRVSP